MTDANGGTGAWGEDGPSGAAPRRGPVRRLYDWVLHWADTPETPWVEREGKWEPVSRPTTVAINGRRVIEHTLRAYRKAQRVQDVVLVIRPGSTSVYEPLRTPHLHLVENPDPSRGMISSIRVGLECGWAHQRKIRRWGR